MRGQEAKRVDLASCSPTRRAAHSATACQTLQARQFYTLAQSTRTRANRRAPFPSSCHRAVPSTSATQRRASHGLLEKALTHTHTHARHALTAHRHLRPRLAASLPLTTLASGNLSSHPLPPSPAQGRLADTPESLTARAAPDEAHRRSASCESRGVPGAIPRTCTVLARVAGGHGGLGSGSGSVGRRGQTVNASGVEGTHPNSCGEFVGKSCSSPDGGRGQSCRSSETSQGTALTSFARLHHPSRRSAVSSRRRSIPLPRRLPPATKTSLVFETPGTPGTAKRESYLTRSVRSRTPSASPPRPLTFFPLSSVLARPQGSRIENLWWRRWHMDRRHGLVQHASPSLNSPHPDLYGLHASVEAHERRKATEDLETFLRTTLQQAQVRRAKTCGPSTC